MTDTNPLVESFKIQVPAPPSGIWGLAPVWFSFKLHMKHIDLFKDLSFELFYKTLDNKLMWGMPLKLSSGLEELVVNIPCTDWDDSYLLLQDLYSIGWKQGYFELQVTHPNLQSRAINMVEFVLQVADPAEQPINYTVTRDDDPNPQHSIFPVVWINGKTYLVFWVDSGKRERQMFVEDFVVDGLAV